MATSREAAWDKYYRGRSDQQTTVKKDTKAYDDLGKFVTNVSKGEIVTVFESKVYTPRLKCKLKNNVVYIHIDELVKPGSKYSNAVNLKPQAFNLSTSSPISLNEYMQRLRNSLEERNDLSGILKSYLTLLVDYWSGDTSDVNKLNTLYTNNLSELSINEVNKDFGEVLGPIAIIKHKLLPDLRISDSSKIHIPLKGNQTLYDYIIDDYLISAKSGTTTNTVKPSSIIDILDKNSNIKNNYINKPEYKIIKTLNENSALYGPPKALMGYLGENRYKQWLNNNLYLKSKKTYTDNELMYEAEKELVNLSKTTINFTNLFSDVVKNKVIYVKYEITSGNSKGAIKIIMSDDIKASNQNYRPVLRTKNGYTRADDKLGIQI